MNLGVYDYKEDELLGFFLSISEGLYTGIRVWYADKEGNVVSKFREQILVKEIPDYGPC